MDIGWEFMLRLYLQGLMVSASVHLAPKSYIQLSPFVTYLLSPPDSLSKYPVKGPASGILGLQGFLQEFLRENI